jgi:dipeptidyl-peptidase-3
MWSRSVWANEDIAVKSITRLAFLASFATLAACSKPAPEAKPEPRKYLLERVDDAAVVQAYADGFEALPLRDKTLIWHLYNSAIAGRDIYYDQNSAHGLEMREILEGILTHADKVQPATLDEIRRYTKLFWINSGPYNNLTSRKFVLKLDAAALAQAVESAAAAGATLPLRPGESAAQMLARLGPMFLDPAVAPSNTAKTPPAGQDILSASHNNLYAGVALRDLAGFKERYPLNSRLVKTPGGLREEVYRVGGRYSEQLTEVVRHLEAAKPFAAPSMARALDALIKVYRSGEAADRRAYDIAWVEDNASPVDTINGFTEVYLDARAAKGSWEAVVFYVNKEKTDAIRRLAADAQWFEDRMPWDAKYRKVGVMGITANAIDVVVETGQAGPTTPVGINLPNDEYVREHHGSKSVSLSNISEAYEKAAAPGMRTEFSWTPEEAARAEKWGALSGELTTNMHEVIGHASGKLADRFKGKADAAIGEYYSALEEARADLVGLYFLADPKLVELKLLSADDQAEIVQTEYEGYTRNVLLQLRRVRQGTQLEEDHMRNRQLIVNWLMANASAIEKRTREGKTYYVMVDSNAFREGVGRLLAEVQRIKSEGDRAAAGKLFDAHGIHFDAALRDEVVRRVDALQLQSYTGFVQPKLAAVTAPDGSITDVKISYPQDLTAQMLEYAALTRDSRRAFMAAEQVNAATAKVPPAASAPHRAGAGSPGHQ